MAKAPDLSAFDPKAALATDEALAAGKAELAKAPPMTALEAAQLTASKEGRKFARPIALRELVQNQPEVESEFDPNEMLAYTVDLAPHADRIVIDGMTYFQGGTYQFPRHMVAAVMEIEQRTWVHEMETVGGKNIGNLYRKMYQTILNGKSGGVANGPAALQASAGGAVINHA